MVTDTWHELPLSTRYEWDMHPSEQYIHGCLTKDHPLAGRFQDVQAPCWAKSPLLGCYCRARHSAASTIYRCDCWAPPTAFFLASRALREDAILVFFGMNRIVVVPEHATMQSQAYNAFGRRLPALGFFQSATADAGV